MPECSFEDYVRSQRNPSSITCLSRGDSIGITVTAEAGLLSLLAILVVLLIIARNVRWRRRHLRNASLQIFHHPMDVLMASLFFADVLQAIGAVMSLKWVRDGKVETGSFCNAQGIIKIFGGSGVAFSTMVIAIYTFLGIWVMKDVTSMRFTITLVLTIWSFISVLIIVAMRVNHNQEFSFIAPTPYWCWINKDDVGLAWKMAIEYLWMWVTLALSFLVYVPLYFWMRGTLIIDETAWWRCRFKNSTDANLENLARRRQSLVMLAYPLVYCLCILPLSGVRWTSFVQKHSSIPPAATFAVVSIFGLSGFFNVILLLKTRPASGLFGRLMFLDPARPPSIYENHNEVETAETGLGRLPPGR